MSTGNRMIDNGPMLSMITRVCPCEHEEDGYGQSERLNCDWHLPHSSLLPFASFDPRDGPVSQEYAKANGITMKMMTVSRERAELEWDNFPCKKKNG